MERPGQRWSWFDVLWLFGFGLASSLGCLVAGSRLGPTFDEPLYVKAGWEFWHGQGHRSVVKVGTLPLAFDVQAVPVVVWERLRGVPFDPEADLDLMLPVARAGALAFWWLLLGYAFAAARSIAGPWAGRLAVAWLAAEPSLLAHAGLVTADVAVSACVLALVVHFRRGRDAGYWRRVGVPALWFGVAVLAKVSAITFGPLCLLAVEAERLARAGAFGDYPAPERNGPWPRLRAWLGNAWRMLTPFRQDLTRIGLGGMALAFVYCGSDWQPERSFLAWAKGLPVGLIGSAMVWLAEHLRVFSNAGEALARQVAHNLRGHGVYLLGRTDPRAFWYYFPVTLTMKLTVPLLLAPVMVLVVRRRALWNWACAAAAVLLVFSLKCRVQIGVRLMLPLVVFAVVGLAAALVRAAGEVAPGWPRRVLAGLTAAGLAWSVLAAARVWPNDLCYVNEFWGGTESGYLCLSDSNYDWGQGLPELSRWRERHRVGDLNVWYFGMDLSVFHRSGLHHVPLHTIPLETPADVLPAVRGRYLAVGITLLYGETMEKEVSHRRAAEFLRGCRPVARTTTFLIYDFRETEPLANATGKPDKN